MRAPEKENAGAVTPASELDQSKHITDATPLPGVVKLPKYGASPDEWDHFEIILGLRNDLLPAVCDPTALISKKSSLTAIGKVPSRLNAAGEVVGFPGWTARHASFADISRWREQDFGICIQTRHARAFDVDFDDSQMANEVRSVVNRVAGVKLPCRSRSNSSKCLLAFVLLGEYPKRVIRTARGAIEFLGNGQQYIAMGQHQSGVPYRWEGGLPMSFPELSPDVFEAIFDSLAKRFAAAPTVTAATSIRTKVRDDAIAADPVAQTLINAGWMKSRRPDGGLNIRCPFEAEHTTDTGDSVSIYYVPHTGGYAKGHFKCLHSHCEGRSQTAFLSATGAAGHDFVERLTTATARELVKREFQPMRWVIFTILPEGVYLLISSPKVGKSWLALQIAIAVAMGGVALGQQALAGEVLLLALEDNERRLQTRIKQLMSDIGLTDSQADRFHYRTEWPRSNEGGAAQIERWLDEHPSARLVIVDDVLERFRPLRSAKGNLYAEDYDALKALKAIADARRISIFVVHHTRKGATEDPLAMASGTQGLTGSADGVLLLERPRSEARGRLHVIGRDIEDEGEYVVEFADGRWEMVGPARTVAPTQEREDILNVLKKAQSPMSAVEIGDSLGKKRSAVTRLLSKMVTTETVKREGSRYSLTFTPGNSSNNGMFEGGNT